MTARSRLEQALALIDEANAADPTTIVVGGARRPKELAHAEMATAWVRRLRPEPPDELLLAARAHHLRRWEVPRRDYPEGRAGYLRWKTDLQRRHAEAVAPLLTAAGYAPAEVDRVQDIIRKRRLASDPDVQALEDALCLVFLETQLDELAGRLDEAAVVEVLRKSLAKMSAEGKGLAAEVPMTDSGRALLGRASAP